MVNRILAFLGVLAVACTVLAPGAYAQGGADIPRTPSGRPDLSGSYDTATVTPLQRPREFGDRGTLTAEEVAIIASDPDGLAKTFNLAPAGSDEREAARSDEPRAGFQTGDENREAPPAGGDGSGGAAGNVGGYNTFWIDRGDAGFQIDGLYRTSIIIEPPNGRQPPRTAENRAGAAANRGSFRANDGTAWWLEDNLNAPGPYDNPEQRGNAERCLMGFGSTAGPPMLSVLYNNMKRIVQTEDTVMILVEMVHDARIIRMNREHLPSEIRTWLGDSVGHWEGDTLVVDTTNFNDTPSLGGASRNLHVVERFSRIDADTLLYHFTVEDPTVWTAPWSGEYIWPASDSKVYEYACHEANYSFGGILRGARILEQDARDAAAAARD
ncbi:MAG: hypothetical protein QGI10_09335 [Vicinamibacterales bacterium]|jgi:hypothetical protein|nr:hypothetical protein [Vicinamibacterales bacterium]HJN45568.1 hypothetical protein [Vicinamibacterales bacterium]|tara:strand:- start:1194 stop:2342 length:1149 start_codon:yes stop_codon:yes gene_type:complete